ncbi:hypothetical protein HK097_008717 [Rhizophlyctis rosea]|uniref:Uncharacterized protein n=1 Tax=Rhizophlyctis rosea TaxID=64517 RepID=A0AAD5S9X9_9FUNG|nr:hypothetical protein HK097_008717 [Rhizophlyctis rosea]
MATLDKHPQLHGNIYKLTFETGCYELSDAAESPCFGCTWAEKKAAAKDLILGLAMHVGLMTNLYELNFRANTKTSPIALALLLQNLPPSGRKLHLKIFFPTSLDPEQKDTVEGQSHICAHLARACRNLETFYYTPTWICSSFFTSAESFPNLKTLHIALDAGYWYPCKARFCSDMLAGREEMMDDFKRTGVASRQKMPKLEVFTVGSDQETAYNVLDGKESEVGNWYYHVYDW